MFKYIADVIAPSISMPSDRPVGDTNYLAAVIVGVTVIAVVAGLTIAILAKDNKSATPNAKTDKK